MTIIQRLFEDSFSILRNRNFRIYMLGQGVSLIGTFMQQIALNWLVWRLTQDTSVTGLITACTFLPVLLIGPFSGPIADRVDRRKLLIAVILVEMTLAFSIALMIVLGLNVIWPIFIVAVLLGACMSFNYAAQSAFIGDMTGIGEIRKAMAFNASVIETGRLLGPALAGPIVAKVGLAPAFFLNGLSFIAVIVSLLIVRTEQAGHVQTPNPLQGFVEGMRFMHSQPRIFDLLACSLSVMLFVFSSLQLGAPITDLVLKRGPEMVGYLSAASGAGALLSTFIIAPQMQKVAHAGRALLLAALWAGLWLAITSFFTTPVLLIAGIFLFSISIPLVFSTVNALLQMLAPGNMRARVLSVSQMINFGAQPLAALGVGWLAKYFGPLNAVFVNGLLMTTFVCCFFALRKDFRDWVVETKKS